MSGKTTKIFWVAAAAFIIGISVTIALNVVYVDSSTNESCASCHIHPHAEKSWKLSVHNNSKSGVPTDCADCHLPPKGSFDHFTAKAKTGIKDIWSYMTKDSVDIDWNSKKELDYAKGIVYNESCKKCHTQLFPARLTDEGTIAHLYYTENEERLDLQCISCHLDAGHYNPNYSHKKMQGIPTFAQKGEPFTDTIKVSTFESFTEQIPGTTISFSMRAIPAGAFEMGSPDSEPFHKADESPVHKVSVKEFFMGETEVTWDQYWAFYSETMSEGRTAPEMVYANNSDPNVDAISGPTPPFGLPDQGWGGGDRPAITMTHYAAQTYCQWLSQKTGRLYRLPTEAEWEYAARGGNQSPYFFDGDPEKFSNKGFWRFIADADTTMINRYVIYANNSKNRTQEPSEVVPNQFGLRNMLGNVMEYCSDYYRPSYDSSAAISEERVVRGGWYGQDAADVRAASRDKTNHEQWLKTDPQQPKSIWWYSDVKAVGFRVVCEY